MRLQCDCILHLKLFFSEITEVLSAEYERQIQVYSF